MTSRNVWANKKWIVLESWNTRRLCTDLFTVGLGPGRWLMKHPYPAAANNPSWLHSLDGGQMILDPHFCWSNMVESCYFSKTCFLLALLALLMLCVVCVRARVSIQVTSLLLQSPFFCFNPWQSSFCLVKTMWNHHLFYWNPFFLLVKSPFVVLAATTSWGVVARSRRSCGLPWGTFRRTRLFGSRDVGIIPNGTCLEHVVICGNMWYMLWLWLIHG